jgi:hypothetical protein
MMRIVSPLPWWLVALSVLAASCGRDADRSVRPEVEESHAVWRVPSDFATIQEALDNATDGDTVLLAPGTYRGEGNRSLRLTGKSLALIGSGGADSCILDFDLPLSQYHRGLVVARTGLGTSLIRGLSFRNGVAESSGGGFVCSAARLELQGCMFEHNAANDGGAVLLADAEARITDCAFLDSWAWESGGAMCVFGGGTVLERCWFSGNDAVEGGAIFCQSARVRLVQVQLQQNSSSELGAALECERSSVSCVLCTIANNSGDLGGGIYMWDGAIDLESCTIVGNVASRGGGMHLEGIIAAVVRRSILWGDCAGTGDEVFLSGGATISFQDCAVDSTGIWGRGRVVRKGDMVYADPRFCRFEGCGRDADYHLAQDSPCRLPSGAVLGASGDVCP